MSQPRSQTKIAAALPRTGVREAPSHASSACGVIKMLAGSAFAEGRPRRRGARDGMSEAFRRPGSARNSSGPTHGDGERAGEIRLRPLFQERLALHHVVHGLGDIGRMIAHALEIFGAK